MKSLILQVVTRVNKCDFTVDGTKISTNLVTPILRMLVDTIGREAYNCVIPLICYKIYICTFRYVYMYVCVHARQSACLGSSCLCMVKQRCSSLTNIA